MGDKYPRRKKLRLEQYDYSSKGTYFVTICIQRRNKILSDIIEPSVGVGALDDPLMSQIQLTECGKIVEKNLLSSESILGVKIDCYVIMPNHIHVIIFLDPNEYVKRCDGSSKAPTPTNEMLPHVISTFKRFCNKEIGSNIFQRGYVEHIIRNREDYETKVKYIYENPMRWYYDELYVEG